MRGKHKLDPEQSAAAEQALARSVCYKLLSLAFLYPDEELFSLLKGGQLVDLLQGALGSVRCDPEMAESLEALAQATAQIESLGELQARYDEVFGHTISKECPPYETQYGEADIFQQAQRLGDIAGFYRAFGLELSEELKDRLDHIAVELEFMHFLTYKEAYARAHHDAQKAQVCRSAQAKFLNEHLGRWAPFFAKLLARKAESERLRFWRALAVLTGKFMDEEAKLLKINPRQYGRVNNPKFAPEGSCFPCGAQSACPLIWIEAARGESQRKEDGQ